VAVSAIFVMVGVLAWLVDAGLSSKAKVRVRYSLFAMFAVVLGLFFLIEDDSEFEYGDWERSKKETGGDLGSGVSRAGGGQGGPAAGGGGRGSAPEEQAFFADEEAAAEEQASGDRTIQDCPKCPEVVPVKAGRGLIGSTSNVAIKGAELGPAKSVAVGRDFGIGKSEVNVEQFKAFVKEAEYRPGKSMSHGHEARQEGAFPPSGLYAEPDQPCGLRQLERCEPLHGRAEPQDRSCLSPADRDRAGLRRAGVRHRCLFGRWADQQ